MKKGRFFILENNYINLNIVFETYAYQNELFDDIINELNSYTKSKFTLYNSSYNFVYLDKIIFNENKKVNELEKEFYLNTYIFGTNIYGKKAEININQM